MTDISSRAEYRDRDRRFARHRQDWLYIPIEPSPAPIRSWIPDWACAIGIVLLGMLAFPAADFVVDLVKGTL